jgi:hypothetical protein
VRSDELALEHGICRAHVNRNVAKLVDQLSEQLLRLPDGPLPEIGRTVSTDSPASGGWTSTT